MIGTPKAVCHATLIQADKIGCCGSWKWQWRRLLHALSLTTFAGGGGHWRYMGWHVKQSSVPSWFPEHLVAQHSTHVEEEAWGQVCLLAHSQPGMSTIDPKRGRNREAEGEVGLLACPVASPPPVWKGYVRAGGMTGSIHSFWEGHPHARKVSGKLRKVILPLHGIRYWAFHSYMGSFRYRTELWYQISDWLI